MEHFIIDNGYQRWLKQDAGYRTGSFFSFNISVAGNSKNPTKFCRNQQTQSLITMQ